MADVAIEMGLSGRQCRRLVADVVKLMGVPSVRGAVAVAVAYGIVEPPRSAVLEPTNGAGA